MTTKISKITKLKSYLTLPISAILFFAFVEKVPAKVEMKNVRNKQTPRLEANAQKYDNQSLIKEKSLIEKEGIVLKNDTIKQKKQKVEKIQP